MQGRCLALVRVELHVLVVRAERHEDEVWLEIADGLIEGCVVRPLVDARARNGHALEGHLVVLRNLRKWGGEAHGQAVPKQEQALTRTDLGRREERGRDHAAGSEQARIDEQATVREGGHVCLRVEAQPKFLDYRQQCRLGGCP